MDISDPKPPVKRKRNTSDQNNEEEVNNISDTKTQNIKKETRIKSNNESANMSLFPKWGDWMGSWKGTEETDHEQERIDHQKAAFGTDTLQRLKDINVLIIGVNS